MLTIEKSMNITINAHRVRSNGNTFHNPINRLEGEAKTDQGGAEEMPINSITSLLDITYESAARRPLVFVVITHELLNNKNTVSDKDTRDDIGLVSIEQHGKVVYDS